MRTKVGEDDVARSMICVTLFRRGARGGKRKFKWPYCLAWKSSGKWHQKTVRTKRRRRAEQVRERWEDTLNGWLSAGESLRWGAFVEEYLEHYAADHAARSVVMARYALGRFGAATGPEFLGDVNHRTVEQFKVARLKETGPSTAAKDLRTLHAAFAWAIRPMAYINSNPAEGAKVRRQPKIPPVVLDWAEAQRFWEALSDRPTWVQASLRLAAIWALRAGELSHLELADVDLKNKLICVQPKRTGWTPKNPKVRYVPVDPDTGGLLHELSHRGGYLLRGPCGSVRAHQNALRQEVRMVLKSLGLKELAKPLHGLRATAYTNMRLRGVPQHIIDGIVGHGSGGLAVHYDGTTPEQAARIALELYGKKVG